MQTAGPPSPATTDELRSDGLRKSFGDVVALRGLDLVLRGGELMVLLGPAGAGKTTLLQLLAGSLAPDQGRVLLGGVATAVPRPVALVPPLASLAGTVAQAVLPAAGWRFWRQRADADRRSAALAALELLPLADRPVAGLSTPEQLRTAIAAAMAAAPQVLLLDEPWAGLAAAARWDVLAVLRDLHRRLGRSMLVATEDAEAALMLAGRLAVLEGGVLRQVGSPRGVYDNPASARVARATGPCNLLPGTVLQRDGDACRLRLDTGPEVEATDAGAGPPGSRCCFMIRPERVAVAAASAEEIGEGAVAARLQDAVFQGSHMRVHLQLGEAGPLLVAHRPAAAPLPPLGDPVAVAWQRGHARALPLD